MSNPFANWTPEIVAARNAEIKRQREEYKNGTKRATRETIPPVAATKPLSVETIEPTKKPLLNKTETLWKAELERRGHKIILVQALTFRLGDGLTYRPDLVTVSTSFGVTFTCYETKAPHRFAEKGIVKVKAAAKQYPFIRFVLVMRNGGEWTERVIGNE